MLSKIFTSSTYGIDAYIIEVETNVEKQMPGFIIVGLPDNAVKESRARVTAAIKNSGFEFPIAVGFLEATEKVDAALLSDSILLGELSLDGTLRPIKGALPISVEAK